MIGSAMVGEYIRHIEAHIARGRLNSIDSLYLSIHIPVVAILMLILVGSRPIGELRRLRRCSVSDGFLN